MANRSRNRSRWLVAGSCHDLGISLWRCKDERRSVLGEETDQLFISRKKAQASGLRAEGPSSRWNSAIRTSLSFVPMHWNCSSRSMSAPDSETMFSDMSSSGGEFMALLPGLAWCGDRRQMVRDTHNRSEASVRTRVTSSERQLRTHLLQHVTPAFPLLLLSSFAACLDSDRVSSVTSCSRETRDGK